MKKKRPEIPRFNQSIIETHCHLDYLKNERIDDIVKKSLDYRIEKIITICVNQDNLNSVIDIAEQFSNVYTTQGIHPHHATQWSNEIKQRIYDNLKRSQRIIAIGEIGLDYYYNKSPRAKQLLAFEEQINLACELELPFIIHSRDADEDMISILDNFASQIKSRAVIHSFTSTRKLAEKALDLNLYLGFNGIITFKNATEVVEVLDFCPLDHLLVETDSPFLTPVPYRGKENAPYYLPFIIDFIAQRKALSIEDVINKTTKNALNLFSLIK